MSYWSERQKQLYKAMEKDEVRLKKRLSSFYDREYAKLEKTIAAFYEKFGTDNVIEYRNLLQSLSEADKVLLIEQFDEFAKKYPQYAHLLPVRNNIYKLNRLEGLQYSVRMSQLNIGAVNNEEITKYLQKQAERGVNAAAEAMGFGKNFNALNGNIAAKFVDAKWSNGKNFSERIWENADKLSQYLNNDIATGFARGVNYRKLTDIVQKRFSKVTRNDAYRLIYTEGTYVMAESSMAPFEEDFEKYRVSTVGDGRVCPICRDLSGQVFNIKDRQPGVNFPPLHPWCRCSFTIEVDDWDAWMDEYEKKHGPIKEDANKIVLKIASPGSMKTYRRSLKAIQENKAGLDKRRTNILNRLPNEGDFHRFNKGEISIRDLAYLSSAAGVEFALFRSKREDILVRGNRRTCNITGDIGEEILDKKYEWVAHTHVDGGKLKPSSADISTLKKLNQKKSILLDIYGNSIEITIESI